jgi:hypothetical protein
MGKRAKFADVPAAYVELISRKTNKPLGTFLAAQGLREQPIDVDGKTYDISLRYKRVHYPFTLTLKNFEFRRYVGTNTAKDFRSTVILKDPRHNVDREVPIWMNNPLRYDETTFYQSDFDHDKEQYTILSAVNNPTWMTPYVACMLVATGMLTHFGIMLVRFLKRRADDAQLESPAIAATRADANGNARKEKHRKRRDGEFASESSWWTKPAFWFPALVVALAAVFVLGQAQMPTSGPDEMAIYRFGKLPLAYQGRIKPYDTLALNTLQIISGRQELAIVGTDGKKTYKPAIIWLLDVISGSDRAYDHQVFRVDNLELLDALDLPHRPQHWRYSLREILETKRGELHRQIELAAKVPEEERSLYQKKVIELASHQRLYGEIKYAFEQSPVPKDLAQLLEMEYGGTPEDNAKILAAFQLPTIPKDPNELVDLVFQGSAEEKKALVEKLQKAPDIIEKFRDSIAQRVREDNDERAQSLRREIVRILRSNEAPCGVPPTDATVDWKPLYEALTNDRTSATPTQSINPAAVVLRKLLDAYEKDNVAEFNKQLAVYSDLLHAYEQSLAGRTTDLKAAKSEILAQPKIDFEVFYNQFSPFFYAAILYFFAFLLGVFSWIGWSEPLRRASIWLLAFTLVLHTFALVARIYISGRPPITNLYSTAIFIGWGGVILAMLFEAISWPQ